MNILIVEDNADTAESEKMFLEQFGHQVRAVDDADAAMAAAHLNPPDVMLIDIGLPGKDGCQLAEQIRRDGDLGNVELIALTGFSDEEAHRRVQAAGFDHHLIKPDGIFAIQQIIAVGHRRREMV